MEKFYWKGLVSVEREPAPSCISHIDSDYILMSDTLHIVSFSANHSTEHSAAAAQHEYCEKIPGNILHTVINNQRNYDQNNKV